jgi:hypothetical protein
MRVVAQDARGTADGEGGAQTTSSDSPTNQDVTPSDWSRETFERFVHLAITIFVNKNCWSSSPV